VMNGLAQEIASVVDGLKHGASSVVVHVCALKIRKAIPLPLEKKDHKYIREMLA